MRVDEILEAISKMEWDDLQTFVAAFNDRANHLNKLELQKFKPGDRVKVKDTKGNYHYGHVYSVTSTQVRVDTALDRLVNVSPHLLTKWTQEGEVLEGGVRGGKE